LRGAGAEILGGFDERARDVLEGGVNGEKDKGRVDVSEHEDDGEWAVEEERDGFVSEMKILEEAVENAFAAENGFPGVAADEIADPQGHDDELVEEFLAAAGMKREVVGERIAEEQGAEGYGGGDAHGAEEDFDVDGLCEESVVIVEVPLVDEEAVFDGPEAVGEHQGIGKQEEKADPEEGRERNERFVGAGKHREEFGDRRLVKTNEGIGLPLASQFTKK